MKPFSIFALLLASGFSALAAPPDLTTGEVPNSARYTNLGPTGLLGWAYHVNADSSESRQIQVQAVDAGSPAAGKLLAGDVILGADGTGANPVNFTADARRSFSNAINDAEARTPAELKVLRWRAGTTTTQTLTLRTMGAYSATAPYNCPKSAKILEEGLQAMMTGESAGYGSFGTLALLAGNNPANPNNAARLLRAQTEARALIPSAATIAKMTSGDLGLFSGRDPWSDGHQLIVLTEYYLRTNDALVLPAIDALSKCISNGQNLFGTYSHRYATKWRDGSSNGPMRNLYGTVNSSSMLGWLGLLLTRECGVTHADLEPAITRASRFHAYYAGRGAIPYGEHDAYWQGHENNGKSGLAALCFELESTRTAEQKMFAKMAVAATSEREIGHTGPYFNYAWSPIGAAAGGEAAAAAHFSGIRWMLDLNRRWNGSFVYDSLNGESDNGGGSFSGFSRSTPALLTYALPLRQLHITGRGHDTQRWLSAGDVADAAAVDHYSAASRSTSQLVADLGSWSPRVQRAAAEELGNRPTETTALLPALHAMATDLQGTSRPGACFALGYIGDASSAGILAALLTDPVNLVRYAATAGLTVMPPSVRQPHLNTVLAAAASTAAPLLPFNEEDPAHLTHAQLGPLLFDSSGMVPTDFSAVDKNFLHPAVRAIASNPVGRCRSTLARIYNSLNQTDFLALADAVVYSAYELTPADKMFAYGDRLAAQRVLEKFNAAEGVPLSVLAVKDDMFGSITADALGTLQLYAGGSKTVRPEPSVESAMNFLIQTGNSVAEAQAVLGAIASDPNPAPLVPLKSIQSVAPDSSSFSLPTNLTTLRTTSNDYAKGDSIYTWRKIHGAGNVAFSSNGTTDSKNTNVIIDGTPGKYLFEVKMSDSKNLTEVFSTVAFTLNTTTGTLPANNPPVATNQSPSVPQATATPITLSGSDPEGYALNYRVTSQPTNGTLTGNAPYLVYTSNFSFTGSDSFIFEAMDSEGQTSLGTVNITVTAASSFPAAIYEPFNYPAGGLNGRTGASEVGFNGAWTAPTGSNVVAGSLAYGNLPTLGGSMGNLTSNYGGRRLISTSALSATGLLNDGSTLWFSVVMGYGAGANTTNARMAIALANSNFDTGNSHYNIVNETPQLGSGLGVTLGNFEGNGDQTNGKFVATHFRDSTSGSGSSGNVFGTVPRTMIGVSQQRLIVGKITWGATSDKLEIYEPDANLNLGPVTSTLTVNVNQSTFDTLTWRRSDVVTMDEIRFGSNYSSVLNGNAPMTADASAPGPGLMSFHQVPTAAGPASISMAAAAAYDPNGVEYFFTSTAGGGHDSGWQDSPNYTDTNLTPGVLYSYTVQARDKSPARNVSQSSAVASASISTQTTLPDLVSMQRATAESIITTIGMTVGSVTLTYDSGLPAGTVLGQTPVGNQTLPLGTVVALVVSGGDTVAPTPNPATFAVAPAATNSSNITMTATTGSDPSGVQYLFTETSGNPGGSSSTWQDSPVFTDSGLNPATQYTYTVTIRDKSPNANPTAPSAPSSATTNSIPAALTWYWDGGTSDIPTNGNGSSAGGNGNWNTTLRNWDVGNTAYADWNNTANKTALFGGTAGTVTIGSGGVIVGDLQFATANYIINGGPLTVSGAGPIQINVAATIQSVVAGNVGLTKSGTGTLTLSAANTYTGTTTITGGTLSGNVSNFLPTNSNVIVNPGGTLAYGTTNVTYNALNVALNGGNLTGADFTTIILGTFTLGAGTTSTISNGGRRAEFAGNFTGSGNLNSTAAGNRYFLSGTNDYTGTTRLTGVTGNVVFTKPSALYNSVQENWTPANITVNSGAILGIRGGNGTSTGFDSTQINTLLSNLSTINNNGLLAGSLVNIDTTTAAFNYTGVIRDSSGPGGGAVGVYLTPGNTLTLSGANTYSGKTIYRGYFAGESTTLSVSSFNSVFTNATLGTVRSASSSLGAPTTVANGTIDIGSDSAQVDSYLTYTGTGETTDRVLKIAGNSASDTIISQSGSGLLKFTSSFTKPGSNPTPLTLTGSGNGEIAGGIPALGNLTKSGSGTWTLSGTNTYTGTTSVTGGTLACSSAVSLGSGALNINSGAKLQLNFNGTRQVASLKFNSGTAQANGTYGSTASTATNKNDTYFAGTGTVTVGPLAAVTTTALALTSGSTPSPIGTALTFTATVTGSVPTGSVTFFAGSTTLGTSSLNGSSQASLTTTTLPIGSYQITARYNSDVNNQTSTSAALAIQITNAIPDTPTNLLATPRNQFFGLTWTVSARATSYQVKRSLTNGGPYTVIGNPTAASYDDLSVVNGTPYYYVVSAINDAGESADSNQVSGIPGLQPSTTTLASSPAATGTYGTSVTFTATVSVSGGTATGMVTFMNGSTVLGTGTLNAGTATFATSTLAVANYSITATYAGDTIFVGSISAPSAYLVTAKPLTITGVTAANKEYDGNTTATLSGGTLSGVVVGETVNVVPGSGTFASPNAGTWAVTATGYSLGGANAGNYVLSAQPTVANATISARPVQLTGTRSYDGTVATGVLSISNNIDGANLTLTGSANLVGKNVGAQAVVMNIAAARLVRSATGNTGNSNRTSINVNMVTAPVAGNTMIAVISTRGTSANRVSAISQTGATWSRVAQATNSGGTTTEIWFAPSVAANAATAVTISQASLRSAAVVMEYSGVLAVSPTDQITNATGNSNSPVTGTTLTTTQANELWIGGIGYINSTPTLGTILNSFTSVASAQSTSNTPGNNAKVYALNRIVNATGTASSGGTLSASAQWSGAIATFRTVTPTTLALSGSAAANYTLSGGIGTVQITPKALSVSGLTASGRAYDGTSVALLGGTAVLLPPGAPGTGTTSDGKPYTGDAVALSGTAVGNFVDPSAGTAKAVTLSGLTLTGADSGNFTLSPSVGLTADITPKALTVTASNQSKTFGQSLTFGSGSTLFTSNGLQNGETIGTVTLTCAGGDAAAGVMSYPITPSAATGGSFSASNYAIDYVAGTLTVDAAATSTTLSTSGSPSTFGGAVTFTATVVPAPSSGTVQFYDNGLALGSPVPLSGGQAQLTTSTLATGNHSITATYAGSNDHAGSTATAMNQTVEKATPAITTPPTATDITFGQSLANTTLNGGAASVSGSFIFIAPATEPPVGTASHSVTFTPADTLNYENAITSVSVTVNAAATPFEAWAANPAYGLTEGINDGPLDDPDFDGFSNLLEFVLSGGPMASSQAIQPKLTKSAEIWVFSYHRSHLSESSTIQLVEYGNSLTGWTPLTIPADTAGAVTITPGASSDYVEVSIPPQGANGFARLKVTVTP